jgi:acetyl esterase/lipase
MTKRTYMEPFHGPLNEFVNSEELPEGVKTVSFHDDFGFPVDMHPDVVYAARSGETQHLQILTPVDMMNHDRLFPLIVFVQGSAFHRQMVFQHLQHMVRLAEKGYAVAMVEYRPSEVAVFPAQTEDAKTAVRFMRMHAKEYHVDPDHIALFGDSSGGHTALMAGITADRELDTDLYKEYSPAVSCIVDWYGPTDIAAMNEYPSTQDHVQPDSPEGCLIGGHNVVENPQLADPTVIMNHLSREQSIPPILIMHGSRDHLVPFNQSCRLYRKLKELGKQVEMYRLEGGYHAFGGFNCEDALQLVLDFLKRNI